MVGRREGRSEGGGGVIVSVWEYVLECWLMGVVCVCVCVCTEKFLPPLVDCCCILRGHIRSLRR